MCDFKIKCIAIDDEPLALEKMENFIAKVTYLELENLFDNPLEAVTYLKNNPTDLIFLDIQMEDLTGIQLMQTLKDCPKVIFTTAYDQYALKGFELDVVDYLLKPISFDRFLKATEKAYNLLNQKQNISAEIIQEDHSVEYVFVKTENRYKKILLNDILYIQGLKDYLMVYTQNERTLTLQNFQTVLSKLPQNEFIRVHKSFVVSLSKIDNIERNRIYIGDKNIPIGETYKKEFYKKIDERKL